MTSARASAAKAITGLDHRIEVAAGSTIDQLWQHRDRNLLDADQTRLVDTHRALVQAETAVTFHRTLLQRLVSGEFPVDEALCARLHRALAQLQNAAAERDARQAETEAALEPVEATARSKLAGPAAELPSKDFAALLAITQGAKLHEHLLTQRLSVVTASRTRITYDQLQRLEQAGLVTRDTSHPVHAGQPISLTEAGRALLARPRAASRHGTPAAPRAGAWPTAPSRTRR